MANNRIAINIFPQVPTGSNVHITDKFREQLKHGVSLNLYTGPAHTHTHAERGQAKFLNEFNDQTYSLWRTGANDPKVVVPSLWMLAHAYLESDAAVDFIDKRMVLTSSASVLRPEKNQVFVAHDILGGERDSYSFNDQTLQFRTSSEGLALALDAKENPASPIWLGSLISKYGNFAKALFLMNNSQLDRLASRVPRGAIFAETGGIGVRGYSFGGNPEESFFGITTDLTNPMKLYGVSIGGSQ